MGACFNSRVFSTDDREAITRSWDNAVEQSLYEDGHSYSGEIGMLRGSIQWVDKELENEDTAEDYVVDHHEKWEPAMAVSFTLDGKKAWLVGGWCSS
jgi:hypothetical protein